MTHACPQPPHILRGPRLLRALPLVAVVALLSTCKESASANTQPEAKQSTTRQPTAAKPIGNAVSGPSWIAHLGLTVASTKLGRQGGTGAPPEAATAREPMPESATMDARFSVSGADLYRFSCRPCHGPAGLGAPDEIPSLLPFVAASVPALLGARMAEQGHPMSEALLEQVAAGGVTALRARLKSGGVRMPPFSTLRDDEIERLIGYLQQLAGATAPAQPAAPLDEQALRVGELVAKGTCHICHAATGPGNPHLTMMQGVIPSLASFARAYPVDAIVRKVREGRASTGMMMMHGRRVLMPPFPYLTAQEIAAARGYLATIPPRAEDRWPVPQTESSP